MRTTPHAPLLPPGAPIPLGWDLKLIGFPDGEVEAVALPETHRWRYGRKNPAGLDYSVKRSATLVRRWCMHIQAKFLWTFTTRQTENTLDELWALWAKCERKLRSRFPDLHYVAVPELHPQALKDGREHWHMHCAFPSWKSVKVVRAMWLEILTASGVAGGNVDAVDFTQPRKGAWRGKVRKIKSARVIAGYLSKYVSKSLENGGERTVGKYRRSYSRSKGELNVACLRSMFASWACAQTELEMLCRDGKVVDFGAGFFGIGRVDRWPPDWGSGEASLEHGVAGPERLSSEHGTTLTVAAVFGPAGPAGVLVSRADHSEAFGG